MRTHRLVRRSQDIRRNSRRLRLELLEPRMCLALDVPAMWDLPFSILGTPQVCRCSIDHMSF